jgi:hypothetical protein
MALPMRRRHDHGLCGSLAIRLPSVADIIKTNLEPRYAAAQTVAVQTSKTASRFAHLPRIQPIKDKKDYIRTIT